MDRQSLEALLRQVVREELADLLGGHVQIVSPPTVVPPDPAQCERGPFLLTEKELRQAERLLPEDEARVLRLRVYAARAEAAGSFRAAKLHRRRADLMEQGMRRAS